MKIINTSSYPRVINYAKGRNMASGTWSADLPLETIHNPMLQKDLANGVAALRLSDADKDFLRRVTDYDTAQITVQQLVVQQVSASPVHVKPVEGTPVPTVPLVPVKPSNVLPIPDSSGRPSLADLKRLNQAGGTVDRLTDIGKFMGSRV